MEPLEGRQLLATLATTTAFGTLPVAFTLGSDGTVFVNQQRPTNNPLDPYESAGLVALPGLNASTIAAFHTVGGLPAVVATVGAQSLVYENVEQATNNPLQPYAWSGWTSMGSFVAKSVTTAQSLDDAAVFAIGANSNIYENVESTATGGGTFSGFQVVPGLAAASIIASDDGSDVFRIFALTGPQSYIDQATTTASATSSGTTIASTPWVQVPGGFVTSSLSEGEEPTTNPVGTFTISLFAVGGDGHLYGDLMTSTGTGTRSAIGFQLVGNPSQVPVPVVASAATLSTVGTYEMIFGVGNYNYQTIFALGNNGVVYENQDLGSFTSATTFTYSGWVALGDEIGTSIAVTNNASGGPLVLARYSNGVTLVKQSAVLSSAGTVASPNLNSFTSATNILIAYHPEAVTEGVTGKPVLVTVGNDGTVYVAQDTTATSSTTTDSYSGWTALSGLKATTIAATTESNGIAVFAMTGAYGYVYVNQYRPTESLSPAYAWTGWTQVGTVQAASIAVAVPGGSTTAAPIIFLKTAGDIDAIQSTPPANEKIGYGFTQTPTILDAYYSITSMSVNSTASGIEVAVLLGAQSYAEVALYSTNSGAFSAWSGVGDYIFNQVVAANGVGGIPAVAGNSASGGQVLSEYLPVSSGSSTSAFSPIRQIPIPFSTASYQTAPLGYLFQTLTSITYGNNLGGAYFDLFSPTNPSIFSVGFTGTANSAQQFTGNPVIAPIQASSLATTPNFANPSLFAGADNGLIYVNQGVLSNNSANPYTYLGWVALAALPT